MFARETLRPASVKKEAATAAALSALSGEYEMDILSESIVMAESERQTDIWPSGAGADGG